MVVVPGEGEAALRLADIPHNTDWGLVELSSETDLQSAEAGQQGGSFAPSKMRIRLQLTKVFLLHARSRGGGHGGGRQTLLRRRRGRGLDRPMGIPRPVDAAAADWTVRPDSGSMPRPQT